MSDLSHHSELHRSLINFVDWVRTDGDREDEIRKQAGQIRACITGKAAVDGLTVRSTPNAGSFAKRTGLRRHLYGTTPVEGQDVDLVFVVSPTDDEDREIGSLLQRFSGYAAECYPDTERTSPDGSSFKLNFRKSKLSYDVVPMLATDDNDRQIILRSNGEQVETSVQRHVAFIRSRTKASRMESGRVSFNEVLRLMKWWCAVKQHEASFEVSSFVVGLVFAAAYDARGVSYTYQETLADWFGWAAHAARTRRRIYFSDFQDWSSSPPMTGAWTVIDPVSANNNVVRKWPGWQLGQFADWLSEARDHCQRAISHDSRGNSSECRDNMNAVFGNHFGNHCEGA